MKHIQFKQRSMIRWSSSVFLLTGMVLLVISSAHGQRLEAFVGCNNHRLRMDENRYYDTKYYGDIGYTTGIGISNVRLMRIPMRFTLQLEQNRSTFIQSSGGLGGGYSIDVESNRTLITTGFYPVNIRVAGNLLLHFGIEASVLVAHHSTLYEHMWSLSTTPKEGYVEKEIARRMGFGYVFEAAWHQLFAEHWFIAPWSRMVIYTSDPFIDIPNPTKIIKLHAGLSVIRRLGFD